MKTLPDLMKQHRQLTVEIDALNEKKNEFRNEIIRIMQTFGLDKFEANGIRVSFTKTKKKAGLDVDGISEKYDLEDCMSLDEKKIRAREDIPIEDYQQYKYVDTLRVSQLKEEEPK